MFYEVIDGQNKVMNNDFYTLFGYRRRGGNFLWGKKEDFDLAYSCVVGAGSYLQEHINEARAEFKKNFIDNFEFGRSLLDVSF